MAEDGDVDEMDADEQRDKPKGTIFKDHLVCNSMV